MFGLSSSCIADFLFTHFWRHKFASGAKGPVVLPVNWTRNEIDFSHTPDAQRPRFVDEVSVLGVLVGQNLSFEPLVAECCARFLKEAQGLISTCRDHSLGLLLQVDQIWNRVEPAALHVAVALASHAQGWPALSRRVNKVHYMVCKELLGCSGASLGVGGQSRVAIGNATGFCGHDSYVSQSTWKRQLQSGRLWSLRDQRGSLTPRNWRTYLALRTISLKHLVWRNCYAMGWTVM